MPKLTVTLKQCTPLLQFQADQEGAGLRATEVKPMLDRFLKACCGQRVEKYRIKNEDKSICAYDYRLTIEPMTDVSVVINTPNPRGLPCFQLSSEMKGIMASDSVILKFRSVHEELLKCIKENMTTFFQIQNFGFCKSKGFGSFYVASMDGEDCVRRGGYDAAALALQEQGYHPSIYRCGQFADWKKALENVKRFHKILKLAAREKGVSCQLEGERLISLLQYKVTPNSRRMFDLMMYVRKDENNETALIDFLNGYSGLNRVYPDEEANT